MDAEQFNWLDKLITGVVLAGTGIILTLAILGSAYQAGWL